MLSSRLTGGVQTNTAGTTVTGCANSALVPLSPQETLEKCYSVPLHNSGVSDVKVRPDHKIIASGGWDGR